MSFNTEVVIIVADAEHTTCMNALNDWFLHHYRVCTRMISRYSGGRKRPESQVHMVVINHMDKDALLKWVDRANWGFPSRLQLYLRTENELRFTEYRFVDGALAALRFNYQSPPPLTTKDDNGTSPP